MEPTSIPETPGDSELVQWLLGNGGRRVMPINGAKMIKSFLKY